MSENYPKLFVKSTGAAIEVLVMLIQDLAPIIGIDEALRLINIIGEAQMKGEEK